MKTPTPQQPLQHLLLLLLTTLPTTLALALPTETTAQIAAQLVDRTECGEPPLYSELVNCRHNTCHGKCGASTRPACSKNGVDEANLELHIVIYCHT
ncbi:hypothetical protein Vi05172_g11672 [Venturia inaequalis]|nr:hypothetical protein Vi05172_g11672 [Venturia inaequalis]